MANQRIAIPGTGKVALTISADLKELGYKHTNDYIWYLDSKNKQIVVQCNNESLHSYIALKYHGKDL